MARPKAFDVDEALDRAMDLFWRKGFEATSVSDLEDHIGVGRQSLYDTFGDKHALFVRALDRYRAEQRAVLEELGQNGAGLAAIERYFDRLVAFLTTPRPRRACLVVNTVLEVAQSDREVAGRCGTSQRELQRAFRHALANAVAAGELPPIDDVDGAATFLVSQVYGLTVLSKNGATVTALHRTAAQALRSFR